jgi:hypothetical protein
MESQLGLTDTDLRRKLDLLIGEGLAKTQRRSIGSPHLRGRDA